MSTCLTNNSTIDSLQSSDKLYVYSNANGMQMLATVGTLQTYMQDSLTFGVSGYTTQYNSPVTGASIQITDGQDDIHLITTPLGTLANLDIILPATPVDMQQVLVNCTQIITALTVDGGANAVTGAPTSLAANGFFTLKYDGVNNIWYRVG